MMGKGFRGINCGAKLGEMEREPGKCFVSIRRAGVGPEWGRWIQGREVSGQSA